VDIASDDPLLGLLAAAHGAVEVDAIELTSPAVSALKAAGMKLIVPLFAQEELFGILELGPRLSEREHSRDGLELLADLAVYAAPAVRVAQLVREQEAKIRDRERLAQELRVATAIQQQFLPKSWLTCLVGASPPITTSPPVRSEAISTTSWSCRAARSDRHR
jgi:hypothetical protein